MQSIWQNERIGDPVYDGLTFGGYVAGPTFVKADYPGARALRFNPGDIQLVKDLPDTLDVSDFGMPLEGPRGTIGYAQVIANQTGISAEVNLTGLSVPVTLTAFRRLRVSGRGNVSVGATAGRYIIDIKEGATYLGRVGDAVIAASTTFGMYGATVLTPSAGAHTYILRMRRVGGSGTADFTADTNNPGYILVEDIGPAGGSFGTVVEVWY